MIDLDYYSTVEELMEVGPERLKEVGRSFYIFYQSPIQIDNGVELKLILFEATLYFHYPYMVVLSVFELLKLQITTKIKNQKGFDYMNICLLFALCTCISCYLQI